MLNSLQVFDGFLLFLSLDIVRRCSTSLHLLRKPELKVRKRKTYFTVVMWKPSTAFFDFNISDCSWRTCSFLKKLNKNLIETALLLINCHLKSYQPTGPLRCLAPRSPGYRTVYIYRIVSITKPPTTLSLLWSMTVRPSPKSLGRD